LQSYPGSRSIGATPEEARHSRGVLPAQRLAALQLLREDAVEGPDVPVEEVARDELTLQLPWRSAFLVDLEVQRRQEPLLFEVPETVALLQPEAVGLQLTGVLPFQKQVRRDNIAGGDAVLELQGRV